MVSPKPHEMPGEPWVRSALGMNDIHPTAVIGDHVEMGEDNYIGPFCYFTGDLEIGNNNRFDSLLFNWWKT